MANQHDSTVARASTELEQPVVDSRECRRCGGHLGAQNPNRVCETCKFVERSGGA